MEPSRPKTSLSTPGKVDARSPVGHWTYSDIKDRLAYEGSYHNGKRDGKWTYYHENGRVRAEIRYKQGELDGECKYFNDRGELKNSQMEAITAPSIKPCGRSALIPGKCECRQQHPAAPSSPRSQPTDSFDSSQVESQAAEPAR